MEKRGQFYLVSAIIITSVVMAIIAVSNYSKNVQNIDLNGLKDQINTEARSVLDHGIYLQLSQSDINLLMQNFTQNYIQAESRDKSLYFVFGDSTNITLKGYQKVAHRVFLNTQPVTSNTGQFLFSIVPPPAITQINLTIDNNSNYFNVNAGENFYFVISQESGGEKYVVSA